MSWYRLIQLCPTTATIHGASGGAGTVLTRVFEIGFSKAVLILGKNTEGGEDPLGTALTARAGSVLA